MGKIICLKVPHKEANNELMMRISRGSLSHTEGAVQLKPRLPMTVEAAKKARVYPETGDSDLEYKEQADE